MRASFRRERRIEDLMHDVHDRSKTLFVRTDMLIEETHLTRREE